MLSLFKREISSMNMNVKKDMNMSNEKLKVLKSPVSGKNTDIDDMLSNLEDM